MDNNEIVKRFSVLQSDRRNVEGTWDLISKYIVPFRGEFFRELKSENEVNWKNRFRFDDTAVEACITLASSIHGAITSPMVRWFGIRFRSDELNGDSEAMEWLNKCADIIYLTLQESNFNLQMAETYLDICSFGTTALVEEVVEEASEFSNLAFKSIPIRECYFEEDTNERVINFYRKLEWTPLQILSKFGETGTPEEIKKKAAESGSMNIKVSVVFCIYTRRDKLDADTSKTLMPKNRPYGYKYIVVADKTELGEEGGYYEMPVFITRWGKASGTSWGYSPAHICLGHVLTLNQLVQMILISAEKVIDPATLAQERGVIGDLDLNASGVTTVRDIKAIAPYESKARFDVSSLERKEIQNSIKQTFKVDQLELKESPAMTATEVQVRYELMQRLLGPTLGRLQNDLLDPVITRTFFILYRAGLLPPMPDIVSEDTEGDDIDIEYLGPMAKAQKMDKLTSVQRWFQLMAPIAEFKPEVLDIPDVDKIGKDAAALLNVPIKSDETIEKERKEREEAQKRAQKLAEAEAGGRAMKDMGSAMGGMGGGGGAEPGTAGASG